ncbi:MAG: class I SAM-dependent methyltransferase [Acidimicrobiia bacterium]
MNKAIDFDQIADLYDIFVATDVDVQFWLDEARSSGGSCLELMCGTGRIGLRLVEAETPYTGLDYSRKLLARFDEKLAAANRRVKLVHADARWFDLPDRFGLIFIGFHSLAEVLDDNDKLEVLKRVSEHLVAGGAFTFSLHNPAIRTSSLTGELSEPVVFPLGDGRGTLEFTHRFSPPAASGLVTGIQFFEIKDEGGQTVEQRSVDVRFHLINKGRIEELLRQAGFQIDSCWGDYDRSELTPERPYMIYRCTPTGGSD